MKFCPLCNNQVVKFHKRSHLIPEWMYTECYDEKHKVLEVSRKKQKVTKKQKGIFGSFICVDCEKETQKYDHYASLILTDRSPYSDEYRGISRKYFTENYKGENVEFSKWENIDFLKFRDFVFSIILKTHFSGKIEGPISLNKKHLDGILAIYKDALNLDDSSYPILVLEYPKNDKLKNHVILPYFEKKSGHHIIEFAGGGYLFNVYVSSHTKPRYVKSLRLKRDGSMYLINMFFQETGLYKNSKNVVKTLANVSRFT